MGGAITIQVWRPVRSLMYDFTYISSFKYDCFAQMGGRGGGGGEVHFSRSKILSKDEEARSFTKGGPPSFTSRQGRSNSGKLDSRFSESEKSALEYEDRLGRQTAACSALLPPKHATQWFSPALREMWNGISVDKIRNPGGPPV